MSGLIDIRSVGSEDDVVDALADVLVDCVEGGASVGFLSPLTLERAAAFWRTVLASADRDERVVLLAADSTTGDVLGTVQLVLASAENQPHRADISKMLVHQRARRRGVGELLMREAEDAARSRHRTLLVLDTATPEAERLYTRLGWERAGEIPDYALFPDGSLVQTTFFFKRLAR